MDQGTNKRPFWMPDTQGFLAIAIIAVVSALAFLLLQSSITFDDKVAGAFMTLLGVLTACLKDVYSYFFGSSKGSDKKDDVVAKALQAPPSPASPAAPVSTTTTVTDESTVTKTEPAPVAPAAAPASP